MHITMKNLDSIGTPVDFLLSYNLVNKTVIMVGVGEDLLTSFPYENMKNTYK